MTLAQRQFTEVADRVEATVLDAVRQREFDRPVLLAFSPGHIEPIDVLDDRQHLYLMRVAAKRRPDVYGFIFIGMGTMLLQQPGGDPTKVLPAVFTVRVTRFQCEAVARPVRDTWMVGVTFDAPVPAPDAVKDTYRKVFTDDPLPSGLKPF